MSPLKPYCAFLLFSVVLASTIAGCKSTRSNRDLICSRTMTGEGKSIRVLCQYVSPSVVDDSVKLRENAHIIAAQISDDLKNKKQDMEMCAIYSTKDFDCDKFNKFDQNEVNDWFDYIMSQKPRVMMNGISDAADTIGIVYYKPDGLTTGSSEKWVVKK